MKLTYRGIDYKSQPAEVRSKKPVAAPVDRRGANKVTNQAKNLDRLISIRPMSYYTYRGVSYTKNLVLDTHQRILLDIDRQ